MNVNIPWKAACAVGLLCLSYAAAATVPTGPCEVMSGGVCLSRGPTMIGAFHLLIMMGGFFGAVAFIVMAVVEAVSKEKRP